MIHETPSLSEADLAVLAGLDRLHQDLRFYVRQTRRWLGTLRRATFARAVQGSNSIEGYHASIEDVAAVIEDEEPLDTGEETRHAIAGYRDAMTYVLQLAAAPPPLDASLIRSLHFMMMKYDLTKNPGSWRPGAIWVEDQDGRRVYAAPDRDAVDGLMAEMIAQANLADGHVLVRAAMAHLNLVLIHPFSDGNGRMARCIQSLVLASGGIVSPEFTSIEEYLGRHTAAYYRALTAVAQGEWSPWRDARPWIEFNLRAHYRQAQTVQRRVRETEALWDGCERLALARKVPRRSVAVLCDAARGWRVRRSLYVKLVAAGDGEAITEASATRDLRALVAAGLLQADGERRGRSYRATPDLRAVWGAIRSQRPEPPSDDPYVTLVQPSLPGIGG
ncbi:MAG TPA: Fic family protein [Acidimicrobiales bacterium]|nr:Fic family protein [Acidimicrobiales bacterium]